MKRPNIQIEVVMAQIGGVTFSLLKLSFWECLNKILAILSSYIVTLKYLKSLNVIRLDFV